MAEDKSGSTPRPRRSRRLRILGIFAILLVALIALAPFILASTGLRDRVINAILASPSVTASTESASFGWFSPLAVHGLRLNSTNQHIDIQVQDIATDRSPWQLLASSPDLGTITLKKPHVRLELPLDLKVERHRQLEPTFTANVTDAALTVRIPEMNEPAIDVDGIDMTFRIEKADDGRVLTLDPMVIFDQRELSPKLGQKLVHLIDPTLGDAPQVAGKVSLSLEKLRIPIGIPRDQLAQRIEVEGKLRLHHVSTDVNNPMRQALVQLVADMNGKPASDVVRLVEDAEIRFQVRDGRLHHEGLRLGFPDIDPALQLTSRGSVGLDQTLDLHVELPRLDQALRKEKGPAKCRITGTINNPRVSVQDGSLVLRRPDRKEPLLAVDGINLNVQVENTASGRVLAVEAVEVLKKEKLSLGLAGGLVRLIDPDLQGSDRDVTGEMSLAFKTLRIPLGGARDQLAKRLEAEGTLTLHQVATQAKNRSPMLQALVQLIADINAKQASDVVRLVKDAEIRFQVRDGRLHHEGLRIGFPEIAPDLVVSSRGSIGLDETLDLDLELPRLDQALRKTKGPAKCRITGTISNPKVSVQDGSLVLRQPDRKEPLLAVDGINLNIQVESTASGRVLAVESVEVLKKEKLSLGLAGGLARLIDPDLQGSDRDVTGEMSLAFKTLRIPLGGARDQLAKHLEAEGTLTLHQVSTQTKNRSPMRQALIKLLCDMNGKQPSGVIRLVQDAAIGFQVRDGRLHHEGLRIGFPEIDPGLVVSSRGSIGLDETLDLRLELPRLRKDKQKDSGPVPCHITGTLSDPKMAIQGGSLVVNLAGGDKPTLTVGNVNLKFSLEDTKGGRMLALAPVTLFEKQKLTPDVGDELLRLVVPTMGDFTGVHGEFSLSLDRFRVPLGVSEGDFAKRVELVGKLNLHQISASVKAPVIEAMVKVLADMHGKRPSEVVRIVKDAEVRFQVREGRLYHEGLRIGFPDIAPNLVASSRGSVGLDHSLDIVLDVPRIAIPGKAAPAGATSTVPVRLWVTGTIEKPVVTEIK